MFENQLHGLTSGTNFYIDGFLMKVLEHNKHETKCVDENGKLHLIDNVVLVKIKLENHKHDKLPNYN